VKHSIPAEFQPAITQAIHLWDSTLRDGEQTPGVAFTREEKIELAKGLDQIGIGGFAVGFPAVSEEEAEIARAIVRLGLKSDTGAFARLLQSDIDAAIRCEATWVCTFVPVSDLLIREKLKTTEEALLAKVRECVGHAVKHGRKVSIAFEDASRAPLTRIVRFLEASESAGAHRVHVCDTVGVMVPTAVDRLVRTLRPFTGMRIHMHCHDDLGLATANAVAAFEAGADGVDVSAAKLGERAGNTSLEEIAVILKVKYGRDAGIVLERLPALAQLASRCARRPIPSNAPIVGEHVFSHESGIHVAGILSNPSCYEPFPPALVGRKHSIVYGKHTGLASLRHLLGKGELALDEAGEQALLERVKAAGQNKEPPSEAQVLAWAKEIKWGGRRT
jgi:isopropylmalate/homocitrate/citramalate synthase